MPDSYRNGAFALGLVVGGGIALNLFLWLDYRARNDEEQAAKAQSNHDYNEIGYTWDSLIGTFVSPSDTLAQWIMAFFTIAATAVLVLTLRSANRTNQAAVEAAEAAAAANRIMRQAERPWLKIQITGCGPIVGSDDGRISLKIDISVTNLGKTPAAGVWHGAGLNLRHFGPEPHGGVFIEACRQSESLASGLKIGSVLFPGESYSTSVFGNFMEPTGRNNDVARTITFAVTATYDGGIEPGGHTVTGFAQVDGFKMIDGPSISDLLGNSLPVTISPLRSMPF
ncbi:MAG: hypothetical protein KDA50_03050 [Rhodobacteraceae bacterium]|nr:hypothetical protein [Paracoccaceae bacterium]